MKNIKNKIYAWILLFVYCITTNISFLWVTLKQVKAQVTPNPYAYEYFIQSDWNSVSTWLSSKNSDTMYSIKDPCLNAWTSLSATASGCSITSRIVDLWEQKEFLTFWFDWDYFSDSDDSVNYEFYVRTWDNQIADWNWSGWVRTTTKMLPYFQNSRYLQYKIIFLKSWKTINSIEIKYKKSAYDWKKYLNWDNVGYMKWKWNITEPAKLWEYSLWWDIWKEQMWIGNIKLLPGYKDKQIVAYILWWKIIVKDPLTWDILFSTNTLWINKIRGAYKLIPGSDIEYFVVTWAEWWSSNMLIFDSRWWKEPVWSTNACDSAWGYSQIFVSDFNPKPWMEIFGWCRWWNGNNSYIFNFENGFQSDFIQNVIWQQSWNVDYWQQWYYKNETDLIFVKKYLNSWNIKYYDTNFNLISEFPNNRFPWWFNIKFDPNSKKDTLVSMEMFNGWWPSIKKKLYKIDMDITWQLTQKFYNINNSWSIDVGEKNVISPYSQAYSYGKLNKDDSWRYLVFWYKDFEYTWINIWNPWLWERTTAVHELTNSWNIVYTIKWEIPTYMGDIFWDGNTYIITQKWVWTVDITNASQFFIYKAEIWWTLTKIYTSDDKQFKFLTYSNIWWGDYDGTLWYFDSKNSLFFKDIDGDGKPNAILYEKTWTNIDKIHIVNFAWNNMNIEYSYEFDSVNNVALKWFFKHNILNTYDSVFIWLTNWNNLVIDPVKKALVWLFTTWGYTSYPIVANIWWENKLIVTNSNKETLIVDLKWKSLSNRPIVNKKIIRWYYDYAYPQLEDINNDEKLDFIFRDYRNDIKVSELYTIWLDLSWSIQTTKTKDIINWNLYNSSNWKEWSQIVFWNYSQKTSLNKHTKDFADGNNFMDNNWDLLSQYELVNNWSTSSSYDIKWTWYDVNTIYRDCMVQVRYSKNQVNIFEGWNWCNATATFLPEQTNDVLNIWVLVKSWNWSYLGLHNPWLSSLKWWKWSPSLEATWYGLAISKIKDRNDVMLLTVPNKYWELRSYYSTWWEIPNEWNFGADYKNWVIQIFNKDIFKYNNISWNYESLTQSWITITWSILNEKRVDIVKNPLSTDINWDGQDDLIIWTQDGYIYAIDPITLKIIFVYLEGNSINNIILSDINNDQKLDIVYATSEWKVIALWNKSLIPPTYVYDWYSEWEDANLAPVQWIIWWNWWEVYWATGYNYKVVIQSWLSTVDYIDWKNTTNTYFCLVWTNYIWTPPTWCLSIPQPIVYSTQTTYKIQIQAYNNSWVSDIKISDGFSYGTIDISKFVKWPKDTVYKTSTEIAPWSMVTYKIIIKNNWDNDIGWIWINKLVVYDYMPKTAYYVPNSTRVLKLWLTNPSITDDILVTQWSTLKTDKWAILIWKMPDNIIIQKGKDIEVLFNAKFD